MPRREFTTAPPRVVVGEVGPTVVERDAIFDPLRYCIFTTLALLAWIAGPAIVVAGTSAVGVAAYWRARRAGLTRSRCVLGDTRLVIAYLAMAFVGSAIAIGVRVVGHFK
jgi:hypothetical protein